MSLERLIWLIITANSHILSLLKLHYIWKYLTNKPIGMQTTVDSTMKGLIIGFIMNMITIWFCILKFTAYYSDTIALIIVKTCYFTILWLYLWGFVFLFTTYFTIFHNHVLDRFEEGKFIKVIRFPFFFLRPYFNFISFIDCLLHCNTDFTDNDFG